MEWESNGRVAKKKTFLINFFYDPKQEKNHISTTENIMKTQKLTLSWSYKHRTLHNEKHSGPIVIIFNCQIYVYSRNVDLKLKATDIFFQIT